MYGLRYGTVPLVRHVGGLADTVVNTTPETLRDDSATGFVFGTATALALKQAIATACKAFSTPQTWRQLMKRGMDEDFSWAPATDQYMALYREAVSAGPRRL